ncbi:hypothetical protein ACFWPX_32330 [Nocardia sp. NPDC058518]|uniref:hypothetical protein n=1 Tax=Nocardia sp. NPDC058518 TaxID=3346534 RepID=UPI0036648368
MSVGVVVVEGTSLWVPFAVGVGELGAVFGAAGVRLVGGVLGVVGRAVDGGVV